MYALFFKRLFVASLLAFYLIDTAAEAKPRPNPITSFSRLWLEWNVVPNTQWAPNSIDTESKDDQTLHVFKFQPVIPFRLNDDWTVLTRTIFRFVSLPWATPDVGITPTGQPFFLGWEQRHSTGLSDVSPTAFLVPNLGSSWTFGVGPSFVVPVGESPANSGKLSVGPAVLAYYHEAPWTVGARMRNVWSISGDDSRQDVNRLIAQPLIRYQFSKNWFFTSSPIISSDWSHPEGDGWTVPVGGGLGYMFSLSGQPVQLSVEGYYNAIKPSIAGEELLGDWTVRSQFQVLFPN